MFSDWSGIAKRSNSLSFIIIGTANKTNIIWQSIVIPFVITSWHGNAFLTLCPANTQRNKHLVITSKRCFDVIITCLLRFMFVGSTHCETKAPVTGGFPYEGHDMELCCFIVRRAGLLWSQRDFEWRWSVPLFKCLTVLEFSFILFDLCLLITFFSFIMNYVPIVTFWIFTYHKIWILSIMFCSIWSYWIIYFLACLEVSWRVVS